MVCETLKQARDKLKEEFQGTERTRQQQLLNLRRDFENLKTKEEETVKQYSDRIMVVVNSIRLLGEQFSEARIVEKVLSTLPERYEAKISSLENSRDLETISLTELINALYAQEQRRASRIEEHQEGVFQAKARATSSTSTYKGKKNWRNRPKPDAVKGKYQLCRFYKRPGHPEARCWFRRDALCQHCKKKGHVERVFAVSCLAGQSKGSKGWLLDSGCTNHMSPDATIFKTMDRSCKTKVKIGNGQFIKAEGKGDVQICTATGDKIIKNVLLVPEIYRNLLSIYQVLEKGYSVVFKGQECQITDPNGSSFMIVTMSDKCFEINWSSGLNSAQVASTEDTKLWHQRLGHADFRLMTQMISEDLVENFTNSVEEEEVYEVCQLRKQARLPFPTNQAWRASEKLQLVHTDVYGPMKTESLNGSRYFILFINDYSRYCWAYSHRNKYEGLSIFQKFKAAVETETDCKLKTLRSDNGTEYTSSGFNTFCDEAGIRHQLTNTYTPQQNGNRLPTKALAHKTPFEAWLGFKPSLAHMKVFGCLCYSQIPANEPEAVSEELMAADHAKPNQVSPEIDIDDMPVRGTRSLTEIYERAQVAILEPCSFEEAGADEGWKQAMVEEIKMIQKNQTWKLVERPNNRKTIGVKWTFAPVARLDTIRLLVALAAQNQWAIHQLDVKSAFLNGFLEEEIYIDQPQGFVVSGKEQMVYRLKKALNVSEPTIYVKKNEAKIQLIVSLYVDDLLVTRGDQDMLAEFKAKMKDMFEMSDLGLTTYCLGMEMCQAEGKSSWDREHLP
ncbi:hypothetical protein CXB51_003867 [Gossypium anomalum]|uniref:Integrase catalytic domain-containing protein n=1 Tax=Gossypium anomalum TaxID=47600 RepID=A0A8J6DAS9_9ROSI|nr:hypothetical protein CXB51_003867 [Gossypium anomalum]